MKRSLEKSLIKWKTQTGRTPLLLRGARQVGKTYLVTEFARTHFRNLVAINFELQKEYQDCFDNLDPQAIISAIQVASRQQIIAGETLLFLDEIQECPQAIMALRYFKELLPELHVIGAGSLLEFAIRNADFRMPVGRVQSLYLRPLSFHEYLDATNYDELKQLLTTVNIKEQLPAFATQKLQSLLHEYFTIGGMPDIVKYYLIDRDLMQCQMRQLSLLNMYRNDFGKYASSANHKYLQRLFEKAPEMVSQHFKYAKIDPHMKSRELAPALENLVDAGLIHKIYHSEASGLPLSSLVNEKKFKVLFLDTGLVKVTSLQNTDIMLQKDLTLLNQGALAEQFVGQELIAYSPDYIPGQLFYWERSKTSATAEVDYVINIEDKIIPVEVKSGKTGRLRSLQYFIENKQAPFGIQISMKPLAFKNKILSVPLYMVSQLSRLVKELL